jgi:Pyridoxamine 5'-phosphate oxidase
MPSKHGDLALLDNPLAQELLHSTIPARLAYVWKDGTPRVIPIWFHWTGNEVVVGSPLSAPKVDVISDQAKVALTIDSNSWPYRALSIRGTARVQIVDGVVPEYAAAAERYFGAEQGRIWVEQVRAMCPQMARISIRPEWVGFLDFETRFPSAIERAMEEAAARPS